MKVQEIYRGPGVMRVVIHNVATSEPDLMELFDRDNQYAQEAYRELVETGVTQFGWSDYKKI